MNAVVEPRRRAPNANPMQMLAIAVERGDGIEQLRQLMDLRDRWEAAESKKAFVTAFAAFKKNMPDVVKDMLNKQYGSDYSSLANLVNTTNRALGEYGLHANWKPDTTGNVISVTCIITHVDGHSEAVTIMGPPDTSGTKNPLQAIKSTLTYLEGATFQAITGVVARSASKDDDGNAAGKQQEEPAPEGYDNWHADMTALADEGTEKLTAAWSNSDPKFRRYVVKYDELWWRSCKTKASKAKAP